MTKITRWTGACAAALLFFLIAHAAALAEAVHWEPAGWGGGGYYYSAAFHPAKDGVIYLGGDVNGLYKSEDNGKTWRMINRGLIGYGVFSIAVDPSNPDTVWAVTDHGISKSTDAGETWQTMARAAKDAPQLIGAKHRTVHNLAIDPANGNIAYAGTPNGQIYKSTDGGVTWTNVYEKPVVAESVPSIELQMGKGSGAIFGGMWVPLKFPESLKSDEATGIGFSVRTEGDPARQISLMVTTSGGVRYRSRNLHDDLAAGDWRDVALVATDFEIDPTFRKSDPDKAAAAPATPDWSAVTRIDLSGVHFAKDGQTIRLGRVFFTTSKGVDDAKVTAIDFGTTKRVAPYGNLKVGTAAGGPIAALAVSPSQSSIVAAATADSGVLLSTDAGQTWKPVGPMKRAAALVFAPSDPNVLYAGCKAEHIWKSTDGGATWTSVSDGIPEKVDIRDLVVSPANADHVFAVGTEGWSGRFFRSSDGGNTWTTVTNLKPDPANPTLPAEAARGAVPFSTPPNIAINPRNPQQLLIAANWRAAISHDGGVTWEESTRGADISCVTDIRFHKGKVYTTSMDEGVIVSADNGATWKQYWPLQHSDEFSGHYWRLDVRDVNGATRVVSTSSPWTFKHNQVVISHDDGQTFKAHRAGLPDYMPKANTMWGQGYARALAVDPNDPNVLYLGIDGDPTPGKPGGGIFKSTDGGQNWTQLPNQPGSRRMFYGLAVDPTDSRRLYWGACDKGGGLYRSDDGGESWQLVFSNDKWIFNVHVTADGTVYALGKLIYRSTDHGKTWKALTRLPVDGTVVGFETHPTDPNIIWACANIWSNAGDKGGVFKSTDGGKTWSDITGDIPNRHPLVIRYNPETNELWAGYVGLYRLKQ